MGANTMTGAEDSLFEDTELAEFSGHIFLDQMQGGDVITIRVYIKDINDTTGSPYKAWIVDTYSGVQACPCLRLEPTIGKVGIKITAQQSSGTMRTITSQWFKR